MRVTRIHSPTPLNGVARLDLADSAARHVVQVLRMTEGDKLALFDGTGLEYSGTIESVTKGRVSVLLGVARETTSESPLDVTLWHGLCRGDRMDTVVQKATELGVRAIQPVITKRDVLRLDARRSAKKVEHWQNIAISAAEQSGRTRVPAICTPARLDECLDDFRAQQTPSVTALLCDPEGERGLDRHLAPGRSVIVLTGSEGGFSPTEKAAAVAAGFAAVSLGPRILRTETAPIVILSLLQAALGDLQT